MSRTRIAALLCSACRHVVTELHKGSCCLYFILWVVRAVGFIIFSLCKADRERRAGCWAVGIAVGNKGLFSHFLYFCLWAGWGTSGENLTWNRSSIFKLELDSPAERGLLTPQLSVTLGHSAEAAHARQPWGCHVSPGQIWRGHYYSKPLISLPSDILVPKSARPWWQQWVWKAECRCLTEEFVPAPYFEGHVYKLHYLWQALEITYSSLSCI